MFRRELIILASLVAGVFLCVLGGALWLTLALNSDARWLVVDTIPGLVYSSEALSRMDSNWDKLMAVTKLDSAESRTNAIAQIHNETTEAIWNHYQASIFDPLDARMFADLQQKREHCRTLAGQFFTLINDQHLTEAAKLQTQQLEPAFRQYRQAAIQLFEMNKAISERRSKRIMLISRWIPLLAGLSGVFIFALGFLVGLRGAFAGLQIIFKQKPKVGISARLDL